MVSPVASDRGRKNARSVFSVIRKVATLQKKFSAWIPGYASHNEYGANLNSSLVRDTWNILHA